MSNHKTSSALYLIGIAILSVAIQYLPLQLANLVVGQIHWFGPSNEELALIGNWRYIKDLCIILVAIGCSAVLWNAGNTPLVRGWRLFIYFEIFFMFLGFVGHLFQPDKIYLMSGLRWMIILHSAVSLGILVATLSDGKERLIKQIDAIVMSLLYLLAVVIVLQALLSGANLMSGSNRLYSLAPNAGALGFWMVGVGIYFLLRGGNEKSKLIPLLLALFIVNLSGSRGPELLLMLLISLEITCTFLSKRDAKSKRLALIIWLLSTPAQIPLFSEIVSLSANRGGIFETQTEPSQIETPRSRLGNLKAFVLSVKDQPLRRTLLGGGLGYGTNTAFTLKGNDSDRSTWNAPIDNSHAAFIAQFGFVGYLIAAFIALKLMARAIRKQIVFEHKLRLWLYFSALFVMTFVQNILENPLFMVFGSIACAIFLSNSKNLPPATNSTKGTA